MRRCIIQKNESVVDWLLLLTFLSFGYFWRNIWQYYFYSSYVRNINFFFNIFAYRTLNNAVKHSIISYQTMQVATMRFITQSRLPLSLSLVCRRCQLLQTIMRSSFHCRKVVPVANTTWTRWYSSSDQGEEPDFSPHSTHAKANLTVPDQARVVICGGGVIGLSVAYHLAEKGWTDVVVLEQGRWVEFTHAFNFYYHSGKLINNLIYQGRSRWQKERVGMCLAMSWSCGPCSLLKHMKLFLP